MKNFDILGVHQKIQLSEGWEFTKNLDVGGDSLYRENLDSLQT